jgi:hypothetical protein
MHGLARHPQQGAWPHFLHLRYPGGVIGGVQLRLEVVDLVGRVLQHLFNFCFILLCQLLEVQFVILVLAVQVIDDLARKVRRTYLAGR